MICRTRVKTSLKSRERYQPHRERSLWARKRTALTHALNVHHVSARLRYVWRMRMTWIRMCIMRDHASERYQRAHKHVVAGTREWRTYEYVYVVYPPERLLLPLILKI